MKGFTFLLHLIETYKVRLLVQLRWKLFPRTLLQSIQLFEATEDDSAWQLLRATQFVRKPHLKAELFQQVMEEAFHAQEFRRIYQTLTKDKLLKLKLEKKALYNEKEIYKIFPYCLVGEQSAAERFHSIGKALDPGPLRSLFQRIVSDEVGHIHKAQELVDILEINNKEMNRLVQEIRWQRMKESWLRSGRQITNSIADLFLSLVFWLFVGFFAFFRLRRKKDIL